MDIDRQILHIIVAAGTGSRFGTALPKQFCLMAGRPVLMETIDRIRSFGRGRIVVVISSSMVDFWHELCRRHSFTSLQDGHLEMSLRSGRNTPSEFADLRKCPINRAHKFTLVMCARTAVASVSARYCHYFNCLSVWRWKYYLSTLSLFE